MKGDVIDQKYCKLELPASIDKGEENGIYAMIN